MVRKRLPVLGCFLEQKKKQGSSRPGSKAPVVFAADKYVASEEGGLRRFFAGKNDDP